MQLRNTYCAETCGTVSNRLLLEGRLCSFEQLAAQEAGGEVLNRLLRRGRRYSIKPFAVPRPRCIFSNRLLLKGRGCSFEPLGAQRLEEQELLTAQRPATQLKHLLLRSRPVQFLLTDLLWSWSRDETGQSAREQEDPSSSRDNTGQSAREPDEIPVFARWQIWVPPAPRDPHGNLFPL